MSSVFSPYPARRRNPFAPFDPNAEPGAEPGVFSPAPDYGGGGAPQDQPMFTPPPTGAMDRNPFAPPDKLDQANRILQGGNTRSPFSPPQESGGADISNASTIATRNAFSPPAEDNSGGTSSPSFPPSGRNPFAPAPAGDSLPTPDPPIHFPGKDSENRHNDAVYEARMQAHAGMTGGDTPGNAHRLNIAGDPLPKRPEPPQLYTADSPEVRANLGPVDRLDGKARWRVAQEMNHAAAQRYAVELGDYRSEINQRQQMGYFRNQPRESPPFQAIGQDGKSHMFTRNLVTGEQHDLGVAPESSKNVSPVDVAAARGREAAELHNRTAQDVWLDPTSTPQEKAQAKWWLQNQPGMFQSDKTAPNAFSAFTGGDGKPYVLNNRTGEVRPGVAAPPPRGTQKPPKKSLADFLGTGAPPQAAQTDEGGAGGEQSPIRPDALPRASFISNFTKKRGRPPTDAELGRAQAGGYIR